MLATTQLIMDDIETNGRRALKDGHLRELCERRGADFQAALRFAEAYAAIAVPNRLATEPDAARLHELAKEVDR